MHPRAHVLGRAETEERQLFRRSAVSSPSPRSGEVKRTALPDTFDGIRFEIGRMVQYVKDAMSDPAVRRQAARIQSGREKDGLALAGAQLSAADVRALKLQAIDDWCRAHFRYVNDPPNVEVIQTPGRMVKQTQVPPEIIQHLMTPFYDAFSRSGVDVSGYVPAPSYVGDCDEGVTAMTGLTASTFGPGAPVLKGAGDSDVRCFFQFGGNGGTLHHVWSKTVMDGAEFHADHTEPGYRLGDHLGFDAYEDVEVEL
jgi:hypothetical protein